MHNSTHNQPNATRKDAAMQTNIIPFKGRTNGEIEHRYEQYKNALMRHRYAHGIGLNAIAKEFSASAIDLEIALGELLSPDDQALIDNAIRTLLTPRDTLNRGTEELSNA